MDDADKELLAHVLPDRLVREINLTYGKLSDADFEIRRLREIVRQHQKAQQKDVILRRLDDLAAKTPGVVVDALADVVKKLNDWQGTSIMDPGVISALRIIIAARLGLTDINDD